MNELIEQALTGLSVPFAFLYYDGDAATYVTYQETDASSVLMADDAVRNYVDFYDVDIYSSGNYFSLLAEIKTKMTAAGFTFCPSRCSPDIYETETKLYHKTLCFAIERSE
ncbi:MAG: hypothetical protein IIZ35_02675 [Clostridia bacterium]|nr:hypothetical protein [Clostridia bacterium]